MASNASQNTRVTGNGAKTSANTGYMGDFVDEDINRQQPVSVKNLKPSLKQPAMQPTNNINNYNNFIQAHYTNKESGKPSTNTRIGDKTSGIGGGSFHIPTEIYESEFLPLYYSEVVAKNKKEYLTEKQLSTGDGPILVDIDLRFDYGVLARQYNPTQIEDMVSIYLDELKQMYQFDEDTEFQVYIFEKRTVNRVEDKQITKDGIHMIIGIQADHTTQLILRKNVMPKLGEAWGDLPITNSWDEVLDEGISAGHINWQLYGSRKPNHEPYKLTRIFDVTYDVADNEFRMNDENTLLAFDICKNFCKLSARHSSHPSFFYKSAFVKIREQMGGRKGTGHGTGQGTGQGTGSVDGTIGGQVNGQVNGQNRPIAHALLARENLDLLNIRNRDDLEQAVNEFLDDLENQPSKYDLREAYDYTMTLPVQYYGKGSYDKWMRVGWALRNISDRLFIAWIAFSAKDQSFDFRTIRDNLYEKWIKFDMNNPKGLTKRSIMYWSQQDVPELHKKVQTTCVDFYIDQTLDALSLKNINSDSNKTKEKGCGDFDIAQVLLQFKKDEYKCVSIKDNIWYKYSHHRWVKSDSGTQLRKTISVELREKYRNRANRYMEQSATDSGGINYTSKVEKCIAICQRLAQTNDKKNIMTEAKELFYDETFFQKLDTNPYLLCFNNGVYDFKSNVFRKGYPEDYVSKTTNIDYIPIDLAKHQTTVNDINAFMKQLFPIKELHDYMWEHLASTLIGISNKQTFNMYIGAGRNGKSVLVSLMEKVLGEYKGDVPLSLVMDRRTKIGGLAPELVALKGIRYAVMQEPSKNDRINEGIMKQLTSGIDPIQARAPYMIESLTFIPQFKLAVCSNEFMEIKSQDHGTWRRIRVVDFVSLFTENPVANDPDKPYQYLVDLSIGEKFNDWKEVFAAMLVDLASKTNGNVTDCPMVLASSNSYRESQDYIAEFIRDKIIVDATGRISKTELSSEFSIWYQSTYGKGGPSPKDVQSYMDKRFGKFEKHKAWIGARINYERDEAGFNDDFVDDVDVDGL